MMDSPLNSPPTTPRVRFLSPHSARLASLMTFLQEELHAPHSLTILQVNLSEVQSFLDMLAEEEPLLLSGSEQYSLAHRLLSLFQFSLTPTAATELPLRVDLLLHHIGRQNKLFLPGFLKNVAEWFGIQPDPAIYNAWMAAKKDEKLVDSRLPEPLQAYHQHGLVAIVDQQLLIPLTVYGAWRLASTLPDWDELPLLLHQLRHHLITATDVPSLQQTRYHQVTNFLLNANPTLEGRQHRVARARGGLVDLSQVDWQQPLSEPVIEATLVALEALSEQDGERYRQLFTQVHGRLWEEVGRAIAELERIKQSLPTRQVLVESTNWHRSSKVVSEALKPISEAYAVFAEFESALGIDRYLGSKAVAPDLERVHQLVREIGAQVHRFLDSPRKMYLRQWNLAQMAPTILSLLGVHGYHSTISDYFPNDQKRVIFIVVDALGYTQFHWFLRAIARRTASPLAGNIFAWLREEGFFNESYLLASNFVSVTGSCLPTIYTGALPKQTGIIGSNIRMAGRKINALKGRDSSSGSKLRGGALVNFYRTNTGRVKSLVDVAHTNGIEVKIFHGGYPRFQGLTQYTYGRLDRNERFMHIVPGADRIFAETLNQIERWGHHERKQKQLALIYYPIIDSTGHSYGPYTQFQSSELAKLNFLFTHFLIDLVEHCQPFFDGQTSIVVTADHGMFESSQTVLNEDMIRKAAGLALPREADIIYDNRACHIYGVPDARIEEVRNKLAQYAQDNNLPFAISTKYDKLMLDLLYDPHAAHRANCPDLILQFYGPGVFYKDTTVEPHRFLYGAHGGCSVEETFVPFIHFKLTPELATGLKGMYR